MDNKLYFEKFLKTGKVSDYLKSKGYDKKYFLDCYGKEDYDDKHKGFDYKTKEFRGDR